MNPALLGLLVAVLLAPAACKTQSSEPDRSAQPGAPQAQQDEARLKQLQDAIEKEIGTPRADNESQCRTIAFGTKACGGPWKYLVYSTKQSNEARLKQLVAEYNALEDAINKRTGRVSDCMLVGDPGPGIDDGVCIISRR